MKRNLNKYFLSLRSLTLLLIALTSLNFATLSTYGQDTICIDVEIARQLLKDADRGVLCDSLLQNRQYKITLLEDKVDIQEDQKKTLLKAIEALKEDNETLSEDLDKAVRRNKVFKIISGAAFVTVAVETVLLLIK